MKIPFHFTLFVSMLGLACTGHGQAPATSDEKSATDYPPNIDGGAWKSGHVQGIAVNRKSGHVYFSFTNVLVKTDLQGKVLGTIEGFTGHLGDLDFNEADGRVYGSLEYKEQTAFYIAIIDVNRIDRMGMTAQNSDLFLTVHLPEVVADYTADMDGDGTFDGNTGKTADHRYGCSGIDGVAFGPRFGETTGKRFLTVAYGIYSNLDRKDNDHQVLLQYDADEWLKQFAMPLSEKTSHRSGPDKVDGKVFVRTGNTNYGVQNLAYDEDNQRWLMAVYRGKKPSFPNYGLFAIEASAKPEMKELTGTSGTGLLLPLAPFGERHEATGIRGWHQDTPYGIEPLGHGLVYIAGAGKKDGKQTAELRLNRWTWGEKEAFAKASE